MTMEHGRLEYVLDTFQHFRAQVDELIQQQHHLCGKSIGRMVALADLPVSISSVKRREGSTRYIPTKEAEEQYRNVGGKENIIANGTFVIRVPQSKSSTKAPAQSCRGRRKPLLDSQVVNQSRQLDTPSSIFTRIADGREVDEFVASHQQQRGNEGLGHPVKGNKIGNEGRVHSEEGNKSTFSAGGGNEELIHPLERKESTSNSGSPLHVTVTGEEGEVNEAQESLPNFEKPRTTSSVLNGGRPSQMKTEVAPDLGGPRLTRNRARILRNAGANVTIARGEPPLKKRRGRKGNVNSCDSPEAVQEDATAGNMQTPLAQTALEQQSRDDPPFKKPLAVKRNTRASLRSRAEKNGAIGEEQDVQVVKMENGPPKIFRIAEKKVDDIDQGRPSKKSRTSLGGTRLNSSSQAKTDNALQSDKLKDIKVNEHTSVEDHSRRESSANKRTRERSGYARATLLIAPIGTHGKFETMGISQNEGVQCTAAADQPVNTLDPSDERNGMESPLSNTITASLQNNNASELRINCNSTATSEVDLADHVNALRADRERVHDFTELPSQCLAGTEDPSEFLFKEGAYRGSRRTTSILSPPLTYKFVEREADVIVLDHSELKDEDTSSISEVPAEEQMEEENRSGPVRAGHPRRFSHPLADTYANPGSSTTTVAHLQGEHSLALELDIIKRRMDAIGTENTDLQFPAVHEASEWIEETKDSIRLAGVSISPRDRDGDVVDQGELHVSPGTASELRESVNDSEGRILPSKPPLTEITHRSSAGTLVRKETRLTELVITPNRHGEELVDEESDEVRREKRLTLLLTTPEVQGEELIIEKVDAVFPCSQLKSTEENHIVETADVGDIQVGPNSRTSSDVSHKNNRSEGDLKVILPPGVDVNHPVGQDGRKETSGILENWQMHVSRAIPSVQKWERSRLLEILENKSLIAIRSSFGSATPVSVNDYHHRADDMAVQSNTAANCEPREDGNEVARLVTTLKQASEPSKTLEFYHTEGISPIDCAARISNAPYNWDLRLSRLEDAKSKLATNLEIEKKVKKNLAELKRIEEEWKRKVLASRQLKEQLVQKKMEKREGVLKENREQKPVAKQEDKAQRHQVSEKKAREKKSKSEQCTPRPTEKDNIQRDELKEKGAGQGVLQTSQARPGHTTAKVRSSLLGPGTVPLRSVARVPVISKEKRTPAIVAAAIQKKGRHPSSSSSSSRFLSLNAEPARFPPLNAESARSPWLNAEPTRLSSSTAECAAEWGPRNSTPAFSLDNRPADVQQGGSCDTVACIETPCFRVVEKEEDLGPMSYEISSDTGSSDDDEEEDERKQPTKTAKHIPFWARKVNLNPHLLKQQTLDPDGIFSARKTCSLKDVFGKTGSQKFQDFGKRSGSGDWLEDRLSLKEELQYKIDMGYVQQKVP